MISSFTGNDEANDGNEIGPDETRQLREDVARLQVLSSICCYSKTINSN